MYIVLPGIILSFIITCLLSAESIYDLAYEEIHLPFAMFSMGAGMLWILLSQTSINPIDALLGGCLGFIPFFILALLGNGGGGDAVIMAITGLLSGVGMIAYIVLFSAVTYLIQAGIWKLNHRNQAESKTGKMQFPFIPHILFGWVTTVMLAIVSTPQVLSL